MKRIITFLVLAAAVMGSSTLALAQNEAAAGKNVYQFCVKGENGQNVSLEKYAGKALLIVNTATKCGFTPQYEELESLYQDYKDKGFEILDFPCNQFGEQVWFR